MQTYYYNAKYEIQPDHTVKLQLEIPESHQWIAQRHGRFIDVEGVVHDSHVEQVARVMYPLDVEIPEEMPFTSEPQKGETT